MKLEELITSETQVQEPTYDGDVGFDVISAVENENKAVKEAERQNLADYLKKRSDFRVSLGTGEQSLGNKDINDKTINISSLADTFIDVMVGMGKDPKYMQETYGSSEGNIDLIEKMKKIQRGKFSGDIQNYIDGKNKDLTGLVTNMFPEYMAKKTGTSTETPKTSTSASTQTKSNAGNISADTRGTWDKIADKVTNFQRSDIGLASEKKPVKGIMNILGGFTDTTQKIIPGVMDIVSQVTMTSPEKFNQYLDEGYYMQDGVKKNAREAYNSAVKNQGYKGSYTQWVNDAKKSYSNFYNQSTSNVKSLEESRGDYWFNTMDEDSKAFKGGKLGSEILQQLALDKWLTSAISKGSELYKGYKTVKGAENVSKGTELATKGTELSTKGTQLATKGTDIKGAPAGSDAKSIGQKIIDWFKKPGTKQDLIKAGAEGGKAGVEFQLIGDIQNGKLSDEQAYGISAGLGALLSTTLGIIGTAGKSIAEPQQKLRTSLSRMGVNDIDEILNWAEAGAKDGTLPSALQRTTDVAVKEAKENVKKKLTNAGKNLGNFRKNLGTSELTVNDFNNTINKSLTNRGIGAKIVEKDGKYVVEGHPGQYGDILNKIADRMNSAVENVKNKYELYKAGENVDFGTNTSLFEDLLSDLKSFSIKEPSSEVRQGFIEIENELMNDLKKGMTEKQWNDYKKLLEEYSKNKTKYRKVEELEGKMNSRNVVDQPKMDDGQYISEFFDELMSDGSISQGTKDRRIAAIFADSFYGVPLKQSDKVMYPSKAGGIEEIMRAFTRVFRNPRSRVTGGWKSYGKDYKPSTLRETTKKLLNKGKEVVVGKTASNEDRE